MLVQLDLKPISRDQLILEVKEIYAGLYALETECIAMDEGYLAAAREKDLCQRSHVDIFQWQLFTALHTQVSTHSRLQLNYIPSSVLIVCRTVTS